MFKFDVFSRETPAKTIRRQRVLAQFAESV